MDNVTIPPILKNSKNVNALIPLGSASMMEEMMLRYEAFAKHAPYIEKLSIDQNRVVLKDNKRNRIAEVMLKGGELQCLLDERADCVHVGFVYSLPELHNMTDEIKARPRSAYGDMS